MTTYDHWKQISGILKKVFPRKMINASNTLLIYENPRPIMIHDMFFWSKYKIHFFLRYQDIRILIRFCDWTFLKLSTPDYLTWKPSGEKRRGIYYLGFNRLNVTSERKYRLLQDRGKQPMKLQASSFPLGLEYPASPHSFSLLFPQATSLRTVP